MDTKIRLHILGLPHTITRSEYSHCAFTGKVLRFAPMMQSRGFEVYHYGVETSESNADKEIEVLTKSEWEELKIESYKFLFPNMTNEDVIKKINDPTSFVGDLGNGQTPLYREFNKKLYPKIREHYRSYKTDIICLPFGQAHEEALAGMNDIISVESGIGYPNSFKNYRIFESYAILHQTLQKEQSGLKNYWFVVPNYFDTLEFPFVANPNQNKTKKTIGFLGRIVDIKGCCIVGEIASRFPNIDFILCGQGDPKKFLTYPNVIYKPPIHGKERGEYLGSLTALLAPSYFCEPFCGVAVEAQLCGTPVITHDFGAMVETVEPFYTGLHCHTLADFCVGVQMALDDKFDRKYISERATKLYDMYNVAKRYEYVFKTIIDVNNGNNGWYATESHVELLADV
jgi:glycosyltransferase involved in cell wall biosynthesis